MWKHVIYLGGAAASALSVALSGLLIKFSADTWEPMFSMMIGDKPLPKITAVYLTNGQTLFGGMSLLALLAIIGHVVILQKMKGSHHRDFAWGTLCNISFLVSLVAIMGFALAIAMPALSITTTMNSVAP